MSMDTPDNYYAILGVPIDADSETLKHAYRQLARRYHPDLAGPDGAVQMKRINRAYDVLSNPEKRLNYDTIIGGVIDLRKGGLSRPRPKEHKFDPNDDIEFSGLSIFSTKGPLRTGPVLHSTQSALGVVSTLGSVHTGNDVLIAAGSLDGKGLLWHTNTQKEQIRFTADPQLTVESLRELRFSADSAWLVGWGRLGLHVWNTHDGSLVWSYPLVQRAVSAHYSLDAVFAQAGNEQTELVMALPLLPEDNHGPRALGVRATDIVRHSIGTGTPENELGRPLICAEEEIEKRQFWAIRQRTLSADAQTLCTLSCGHLPNEQGEMAIARRWNLNAQSGSSLFGGGIRGKANRPSRIRPQIAASVVLGQCADITPPYTVTSDAHMLATVYTGKKVRLYDTLTGAFSELPSGAMGGSARMAISPDAQWLAIAREDSEVSEGVVDLWITSEGRIAQKLYHPWQVSSLHFANKALVVALTDGTIQVWIWR